MFVRSMLTTVPELLVDLSGAIREIFGEGYLTRTSSAAFGGAIRTSATCTGFRRKP